RVGGVEDARTIEEDRNIVGIGDALDLPIVVERGDVAAVEVVGRLQADETGGSLLQRGGTDRRFARVGVVDALLDRYATDLDTGVGRQARAFEIADVRLRAEDHLVAGPRERRHGDLVGHRARGREDGI